MDAPGLINIEFAGDPEEQAFELWREEIARNFLRCDYRPRGSGPVHVKQQIRMMPNLTLGTFETSAIDAQRTKELIESDSNELLLIVAVAGTIHLQQSNDNCALQRGNIGLLDVTRPSSALNDGTCIGIRLDRRRLLPFRHDVENLFAHPIATEHTHSEILLRYLEIVSSMEGRLDQQTSRLVEQHVVDLLGLTLGGSNDAAEMARRGGLKAARAHAIRRVIAENLHDPHLSLSRLAGQLRISERYLQLIFEEMGTTYTEYVLDQRLLIAKRQLSNPTAMSQRIADIALDSGFGDLSHFNRSYRRRFGETPSDTRRRLSG